MKRQNKRTWGLMVMLLAMSVAAPAQSVREVPSTKTSTSDEKALHAAVPLLSRDNRVRDFPWLKGNAAPSTGLPAQGDSAVPSAAGSGSTEAPDASHAKHLLETPGARRPEATAPAKGGSRAKYWAVQGLMFASFVVAVETTHNCIKGGSCTAIPSPVQTRGAMYTVGLPLTTGITQISYLMKKHGNRWWYVPPLLVTAGDALLAVHSAQASH